MYLHLAVATKRSWTTCMCISYTRHSLSHYFFFFKDFFFSNDMHQIYETQPVLLFLSLSLSLVSHYHLVGSLFSQTQHLLSLTNHATTTIITTTRPPLLLFTTSTHKRQIKRKKREKREGGFCLLCLSVLFDEDEWERGFACFFALNFLSIRFDCDFEKTFVVFYFIFLLLFLFVKFY